MLENLPGWRTRRRPRLALDLSNEPIYAIGDVHGRHDLLLELERRIVADSRQFTGPKRIIMLGDYVDRGPSSSKVLAHLISPPPPGFSRLCLAGNHEIAMLAYMDGNLPLAHWTSIGGEATLNSYHLDLEHLKVLYPSETKMNRFLRTHIPRSHVEFLRRLPILIETPHLLFVHAGIRPKVSIRHQTDDDLVSIRSEFLDALDAMPKIVVHGHTPVASVKTGGSRLNLDTGAYHTGHLSAACFWRGRVRVTST